MYILMTIHTYAAPVQHIKLSAHPACSFKLAHDYPKTPAINNSNNNSKALLMIGNYNTHAVLSSAAFNQTSPQPAIIDLVQRQTTAQ
jgi:hypothetical protein